MRLTACSLAKPEGGFEKTKGAFLEIKVSLGESPDLEMSIPKIEEKVKVGDAEVISYKLEDEQETNLISQFNQNGQTYRIRLTYDPNVYPNGETVYLSILESLEFATKP